MTVRKRPVPSMASQRGIALLVVLILLLIMTLLGLASLRGTLLGERMSGNLFDRSLAFQSAESALRQGETVAQGLTSVPSVADCSNPSGVCGRPLNGVDRSIGEDGWVNAAKIGTGTQNDLAVGTAGDLQYLVEYLGEFPNWYNCDKVTSGAGEVQPGCMGHRYRISARYKADGRSQVVLQSIYRRY
jgi:type IV pilus assembly protein PilX